MLFNGCAPSKVLWYSADGGDAEVYVLIEAYIYFKLMGICQKIEIFSICDPTIGTKTKVQLLLLDARCKIRPTPRTIVIFICLGLIVRVN
jgi:hypothetical protein